MTTSDLSTDHSRAKLVENEDFGTGVSRADRPTSFSPDDFSVPTGEEEEWRFTPMDRIADFIGERIVAGPANVSADSPKLETVTRKDPRLGTVGVPDDRSAALAWEAFSEAYVVTIPNDDETHEVAVSFDVPAGMPDHDGQFTLVVDPAGPKGDPDGCSRVEQGTRCLQEDQRFLRQVSLPAPKMLDFTFILPSQIVKPQAVLFRIHDLTKPML